MAITARVEHGDSVLLIEIDDGQPTPLFMRGKVLEAYPLPTKVITQKALVVAPPAKVCRPRATRKFRHKSIQRYQETASGSSFYEPLAREFYDWLKGQNIAEPIRAMRTFGLFAQSRPNSKATTEQVYGAVHAGWMAGLWEIKDQSGSECCLEIL